MIPLMVFSDFIFGKPG